MHTTQAIIAMPITILYSSISSTYYSKNACKGTNNPIDDKTSVGFLVLELINSYKICHFNLLGIRITVVFN